MRILSELALACALVLAIGTSARADDFARTKYPIFLAEGFGGLDYFQVRETLEAGGAKVCNPPDDQVPQFAGSEVRADVLIGQIQSCLAASGASLVNLFGYSQGGEDARVLLTKRPDLLASVTTIGTPHTASSGLADRFIACAASLQLGLWCDPVDQQAYDAFLALGEVATDPDAPDPFDNPLGVLQVQCQFSSGTNPLSLVVCAAAGVDIGPTFDAKYPVGLPVFACGEGPAFVFGPRARKISLFSWGGTRLLTDPADPSDPLLQATGAFQSFPNDGLVERCGTHFGKVLRDDYPWNHLDLINQGDGLTGPNDPTLVYREHAHRLKLIGL